MFRSIALLLLLAACEAPVGSGRMLLVANGGSGTVSVVDLETLSVVREIAIDAELRPHHFTIDADRVLVSATGADLSGGHAGHEAGEGSIFTIDPSTADSMLLIDVGATAHNAAITEDGELLVLAMMEHGMIQAFDAATLEERWSVFGLDMPLEVTPTSSGALLVAEGGGTTIAIVDPSTQSVSARVEVGATPVAAWRASDGSYYVALEEGRMVRRIDPGALDVVAQSYDPRGMVGQVAVRGDEVWAAVEDRGVIAIFDRASGDVLAEIAAGTKPHAVLFDGDRAFVTDELGDRLFVIDAIERTISAEIAVGSEPNGLAIVD